MNSSTKDSMIIAANSFLFIFSLIIGLNAFAGQPNWAAPSEELIARTAFRDMDMNVDNVIVNELESLIHAENEKELFFDYQGVTYNCTIVFPEHIFFNPEMNGYSVGRIDINRCENYSTGASANPITIEMTRRSAMFSDGIVFLQDNRRFIVSPYARMLRRQ